MPTNPTPSPAAMKAAEILYDYLVEFYTDHLDEKAFKKMQAIIDLALADERKAGEEMAEEIDRLNRDVRSIWSIGAAKKAAAYRLARGLQ